MAQCALRQTYTMLASTDLLPESLHFCSLKGWVLATRLSFWQRKKNRTWKRRLIAKWECNINASRDKPNGNTLVPKKIIVYTLNPYGPFRKLRAQQSVLHQGV